MIAISDHITDKKPVFGCADDAGFVPVIRFAVASDTHVHERGDIFTERIKKMLSIAYAEADSDDRYSCLDALFVAGDMTDNGRPDQFDAFWAAVSSSLRPCTAFFGMTARAHDGWTMDRVQTHEYYRSLTGRDPDFHAVINGFHFIGLSSSDDSSVYYDGGQIAWLREQFASAVREDPLRPVFFFHHEHIRDTVYGSTVFDGWGVDFFDGVLADFPQVVDFSGHSHYPLNDPRSLWQGVFTAVGTGALNYAEFTVDDERVVHPEGHRDAAAFWLVEADRDCRLRLRGFFIPDGKLLVEYVLDDPADGNNRPFTPEKRAAASVPPVFPDGASIVAVSEGKKIVLSIPAALSRDGMPVFLYRARAFDKDGAEAASSRVISEYYLGREDKALSVALEPETGGTYDIAVTAETAYGRVSEPLVTKVSF